MRQAIRLLQHRLGVRPVTRAVVDHRYPDRQRHELPNRSARWRWRWQRPGRSHDEHPIEEIILQGGNFVIREMDSMKLQGVVHSWLTAKRTLAKRMHRSRVNLMPMVLIQRRFSSYLSPGRAVTRILEGQCCLHAGNAVVTTRKGYDWLLVIFKKVIQPADSALQCVSELERAF